MKIIRVINEELIDLREFKKPNFVFFGTNEYSNSEEFCTFHEQINPFDLYYKNEEKDKEIERLNNIINTFEKYLRDLYHSFDYETDESEILDKVLDELKKIKGEW